jgi:2-keto-3-deoxy-L-rhamnonate aldolase RhmA
VPEVDNRKTVLEAINAFYYPPIGKRSWGGAARYGIKEHGDRLEYADWWNKNGILGIKIESVKAVLNVRELAQTGVDYLDIGPNDLLFDLETSRHPYLKSLSDCIEHIQKELVDSHIRIM